MEEHRLRVSKNRMLRRIFGPKRDVETGGWRKLHNEEFHNLYSSSNIIRMIKSRWMTWVGHVARMGKMRNAYKILVGKPEGKKPLRRPMHKWEDNVKRDPREIGLENVKWIHLVKYWYKWWALVNKVMNLSIP
jgi:hypothetical protein